MLCSMHCLSVCDLLNTACRSNQCQGTHFAPLLPVLDGADVHVTLVVAHPEVHKMKTAVTRLRLVGYSRSSEALLTKQAAALVRGVDLAAGLRNRLHLLLDLHAAASVPVTQQALTLFVNSICLVKVSRPSLLHFITDFLPTKLSTGSVQTISTLMGLLGIYQHSQNILYCQPEMPMAACQ